MDTPDRTQRLLALILMNQMKGASLKEKILQLNLAGFTNVEIADIVQTSGPVVSQLLYEARKIKGKNTTKKTSTAKK